MHKYMMGMVGAAVVGIVVVGATTRGDDKKTKDVFAGWTSDFSSEKPDLVSAGRNPYFILEPGYVRVLEGGDERLVVAVKDETLHVDGVVCRVVEERETKAGKLVEVSNNYFAISTRPNRVYFGEDAGGAWRSGKNGARFGLMIPGLALVGGNTTGRSPRLDLN
jgi:hypothetical protein